MKIKPAINKKGLNVFQTIFLNKLFIHDRTDNEKRSNNYYAFPLSDFRSPGQSQLGSEMMSHGHLGPTRCRFQSSEGCLAYGRTRKEGRRSFSALVDYVG